MNVSSEITALQLLVEKSKCLEALKESLKIQAQFYREQNEQMKNTLKKLEVLHQDLSSRARAKVDKLIALQETCSSKECNVETIGFTHAQQLRKRSNYIAKIKICMKIYSTIIEKFIKELKVSRSELQNSKGRLSEFITTSDEEIKALEAKALRYEKEITKFEKRYPWLKDPGYNLQTISEEIKVLNNLRQEKLRLSVEIATYHGLKPDINEAREELHKIKLEYNEINKLPK